ncbi:MAG TPA: hypothetical protein GXX20_10545 [Clostridiaceae bacterium]|nr:hypothetical protein [Clostridiaceae bacterium]
MGIPDIIGFTVEDAIDLLLDSGFVIHKIETTSPPREKSSEYHDFYRVVRIRHIGDNKVELLVCNPTIG